MMFLDLSSLEKAVLALETSLNVYYKFKSSEDNSLKQSLKSGVIQNFEVAYEMSCKMLKRYLREYTNENPNEMSIQDIFRSGGTLGLLSNVDNWFDYRRKRNLTSHTYNANIAEDVFEGADSFLSETQLLLDCLKKKIK